MRALARSLDRLKPEDAQQILDELAGRMHAAQVRDPVRYCARLVEQFRRGEFELDLGRAVARQRRHDEHRDVGPSAQLPTHEVHTCRTSADLPPHIREALERLRRASNCNETRAVSEANLQQISDAPDTSD
jgi:hypothetical protein